MVENLDPDRKPVDSNNEEESKTGAIDEQIEDEPSKAAETEVGPNDASNTAQARNDQEQASSLLEDPV